MAQKASTKKSRKKNAKKQVREPESVRYPDKTRFIVRMDNEVVEALDKTWPEEGYRSRNAWIDAVIRAQLGMETEDEDEDAEE